MSSCRYAGTMVIQEAAASLNYRQSNNVQQLPKVNKSIFRPMYSYMGEKNLQREDSV